MVAKNPPTSTTCNALKLWQAITVCLLLVLQVASYGGELDVYCQSETFKPLCHKGESIVVQAAVYGRMSDTGRCLRGEEELTSLKNDPKYVGCYEDVLEKVDRRCSGKTECEIRIPDQDMETTSPCYKHMIKYFAAAYRCVRVVQQDRSCVVSLTSDRLYLSSPVNNNNNNNERNTLQCGTQQHPWLLDAPSGQRINVTLLDFTAAAAAGRSASTRNNTSSLHQQQQQQCARQLGNVEDRSSRKNVTICSDAVHRERTVFVSTSNAVSVVLHQLLPSGESQAHQGSFLISAEAVGCSDLIPAADAWLKRTANEATVGCYLTRQTWTLRCDVETGRWKGTMGSCTQQHEAVEEVPNSDAVVDGDRAASSMFPVKNEDLPTVLILVAITGVSIIVCVGIICLGFIWLCRRSGRRKQKQLDGSGYSKCQMDGLLQFPLQAQNSMSASSYTNGRQQVGYIPPDNEPAAAAAAAPSTATTGVGNGCS